MEVIKDIIESYKYILIDMTKYIKNLNDLENKIITKAHNVEKYKKVVFMIDMKNIENKEIVQYYQTIKVLPEVLIRHTIMLYNKDNYIFFDLDIKFNLTLIKKFIEDNEDMTTCIVCLEPKDNMCLCLHCSTCICLNCFIKINKPFCTICKKDHKNIIF